MLSPMCKWPSHFGLIHDITKRGRYGEIITTEGKVKDGGCICNTVLCKVKLAPIKAEES